MKENIIFLIKNESKNIYYMKENSVNGRIIEPCYWSDKYLLGLTIGEYGYKTKKRSIKRNV